MKHSPLIALALAIAGCSGSVESGRIEPDDRPAFTIDRTLPFWLEFGRGSGWHGLDTIKIDQTGRVVLHRMKYQPGPPVKIFSWEVATLTLSPEALADVLNAVDANELMQLHKAYHEVDIADGTQWVLRIEQADREKSVYFDNRFPREILTFAKQLDEILSQAGLDAAAWQPVPESESRQHEQELWNSLQPSVINHSNAS